TGRRARQGSDPRRARREAGPLVLPVPLQGRSGDAGLSRARRLMAVGWIFSGLARYARPRPGARPRRTEVLRTSAAEREEGGLWNRLQARDALEAGARHRRRLAFGRRQ